MFVKATLACALALLSRVGILWISERSMLGDRHGAFQRGLRDLGWVEAAESGFKLCWLDG
jgi:hypothetical protein